MELPDVGFVSGETEAYKAVRLVDQKHSTRGTVLVNNDGTVHDIGRAKTRGIEHSSGSILVCSCQLNHYLQIHTNIISLIL